MKTPAFFRLNPHLKVKLLILGTLSLLVSGCFLILSLEELFPLPKNSAIANLSAAHRGSLHSKLLPSWENSLPALNSAVSARVPFLEVDLRMSDEPQGDRDLFLFHDSRVTEANSFAPSNLNGRAVQSLTLAERDSVSLDASRFVPIPTLEQAIDVVMQANSQSALQLDLKGESDRLALRAIGVVARRGALKRVLMQIRDLKRIEMLKREHPSARIVARCKDIAQVDEALRLGVEVVELERWISAEAVLKAHSGGVLVLINVASSRFDNAKSWSYLRSRGVDVIMTDYPAGVGLE